MIYISVLGWLLWGLGFYLTGLASGYLLLVRAAPKAVDSYREMYATLDGTETIEELAKRM